MADLKHSKLLETARELDRSGDGESAVKAYRQYLQVEPRSAVGWGELGGLLMVLGRLDEAKEACDKALRLDPNLLGTRINAACVLMHQGHLDQAEEMFRWILDTDPQRNDARLALAECLVKKADFEGAKTVLEQMLQQDPASLPAHQMLGHIFHRTGRWVEYQKEIERRSSVVPTCDYVEYERGYLGLLFGDMPASWSKYEARWRVPRLTGPMRDFKQPRWNGEPFAGKTLLLHYEQGIGDTIMFVRYAPMVKARGGKVILEVQPAVVDLAGTCPGVDAVVAHGQPLPPFDLQIPLMSLPMVFKTDLNSIPAEIPYLDVPKQVPNQEWIAKVIAATSKCARIGLVWAGNPAHRTDAVRSISTELLKPLANLPNVFWFGFQFHNPEPPPLPRFISLVPWLNNFSDTAYALSGMDLVITVDTSVAHLAGAMGIPTLLLLPYTSDWRWLLNREDSPWYPTMRIYRQSAPEDWVGVIRRVVADLSDSPQ